MLKYGSLFAIFKYSSSGLIFFLVNKIISYLLYKLLTGKWNRNYVVWVNGKSRAVMKYKQAYVALLKVYTDGSGCF